MVRSLPMLPSLPRPGDVAATELVAPPMFPLRAVATLEPCPAAVAAGAPVPTSPPKRPPAAAASQAAEAHARHAPTGSTDGSTASPAPAQQPQRKPGFWQRLLGRGGQQQQDPPIDLFIRVDGRGLENVTRAWVDGVGPALADAAEAGGSGSSSGSSSSSVDAREAVAEVSIMQQPRPRLPLHSAEQRPPLPVVGHVSAFFSW